MNVAFTGSISQQYDFTKMTNSGLLKAAQQLSSEGQISTTDASQLVGEASGAFSVPISGNAQSSSQALEDPTQHNFMNVFAQNLISDEFFGNAQAAGIDSSILSVMKQYQTPDSASDNGTLSTLA